MFVELISHTSDAENLCALAAATCTNTTKLDSALDHAIRSGHTSVLEHAAFTFRITGLSRAALAQLTRHRLASFDVQSQRYVALSDALYKMPGSIVDAGFRDKAEVVMESAYRLYSKMVDAGVPKEDARYVIPQAVTTTLVMTMNARELRHFFSLRCCNRAQWEIREMADAMLKLCKKAAPKLFEGAGPGCVNGHCPELKPCGQPRHKDEWESWAE